MRSIQALQGTGDFSRRNVVDVVSAPAPELWRSAAEGFGVWSFSKKKAPVDANTYRQLDDTDIIRGLPHWARVAFVARCGRVCMPLMLAAWPNSPPKWSAAVLAAVELAERAAATGASPAGAKSAGLDACMAAGAALMAGSSGASLSCKPAEFAAKAAAAGPSESADAAVAGYGFALQAAWEAREDGVAEGLAGVLARLARAVATGRWTDTTPVPPSVFGLLE